MKNVEQGVNAETGKPVRLQVPASFGHSAMGFAPTIKFVAHTTGTTHELRISTTATRVSIACGVLVLTTLFFILFIVFGRIFVASGPFGIVAFCIAAVFISSVWLFLFVPPLLNAVRIARRTPVWCTLQDTTCLQIAGEPINERIVAIHHVLLRLGRGYAAQWQLETASGAYCLLYEERAAALNNAGIEAWARAAGLRIRYVEVDNR